MYQLNKHYFQLYAYYVCTQCKVYSTHVVAIHPNIFYIATQNYVRLHTLQCTYMRTYVIYTYVLRSKILS